MVYTMHGEVPANCNSLKVVVYFSGYSTIMIQCSYQVKIRYLKMESMWKISEGLAALHFGLDALATRFHFTIVTHLSVLQSISLIQGQQRRRNRRI